MAACRTGRYLPPGPCPAASYDFATAERSQTANDALGCSPGLCTADDGLTLPAWSIAPADLLTALDDSLTGIDPLAQRIDDRSDPLRARYVTFSPGLRFPDLIDIQVSPLAENRSGVEIYSRARLGKLDFGANRARIEALIAALPQGLTE